MNYSIEEHKHRFASWAASRGASVVNCRFKVEEGKAILEEAGLQEVARHLDNLPAPTDFDRQHKIWRNNVIKVAKKYQKDFTHGVASKLINLYLKSIFVCGENVNEPKIKAIHPPIDSVLLEELYSKNIGGQRAVWGKARKAKWSKLTSEEYEQTISAIQSTIKNGNGLWEIEVYWQGFQ